MTTQPLPRAYRDHAAIITAGLLLLVVSLTGCTGPRSGAEPRTGSVGPSTVAVDSTPPVPTVAVVPCEDAIAWLPAPAEGSTVALGVLAVPTRVLQAEPTGEGWLYAKQGLEVRAGVAVEITVAPSAAGRAAIRWGDADAGPPRGHVRVEGCAAAEDWIAWPGGYHVRSPMCIPLIVRSGAQEARVSVAVGAPCPAPSR